MTLQETLDKIESRSPVAFPHSHFMALAPLDVWARMLWASAQPIPPRYWLRLAACLGVSSIGTAITLPERLGFQSALEDRYREANREFAHAPGALCVLGYFRTGTTHLHYLLDCDPAHFTPTWHHVSAPHGFIFSWAFLRLFMIPFLSETRPQDDVSFGPDYPAEDDFAVNHWSLASSLPGRLMLPGAWEHYKRFHDLRGLTEREFERWRFAQWVFCWKLGRLAPDRRLLLKSPSHTARVPEWLDLFGNTEARFIHISRTPKAVIQSNVRMLKRLAIYHFQDPPDDAELERRVIEEYVATEERYLATRDRIPEGRRAEGRYEDLVAHPVASIRAAYDALALEWSDGFESNLRAYLDSIRGYRPNPRRESGARSAAWSANASRLRAIEEALTDSPHRIRIDSASPLAAPSTPHESVDDSKRRARRFKPAAHSFIASIICAVVWLAIANLMHNRYDWLVWPTGIVTGYAALRASGGRGTWRLGLFSAAATLAVLVAVAFPNSRTIYYANVEHVAWEHLWHKTRLELTTGPTLFWAFMGAMTAWRFGSRSRLRPGGR